MYIDAVIAAPHKELKEFLIVYEYYEMSEKRMPQEDIDKFSYLGYIESNSKKLTEEGEYLVKNKEIYLSSTPGEAIDNICKKLNWNPGIIMFRISKKHIWSGRENADAVIDILLSIYEDEILLKDQI